METADENCSLVTVVNGDESLQAAMDSQHLSVSHSSPPTLTELRLVLLGRKGTGKSSAGNTILGGTGGFESGKPTEECVKRRADVVGRRVTVVDTPGWEWYYPLNGNPNWVRRETLRSVTLCPPGPHAVLLVVRSCTSVTDDYIREIEEHVEPLGKQVWEHTMVLFTRGDELGLGSMEQRILTSGPGLQRLLQKCGNRYHVVNNRNKGDLTQVKELIRKLEYMVDRKAHGNHHLELDNTVLQGLEADGKRRARERRKKQQQMEAQIQRGTIKAAVMSDGPQGSELDAHHSFSKAPRRLHEVRLVLLGERETGKSSAGNTILGKMGFFEAGAVTEECICQQAEVAMRLVTVVDTPGWEAGVAGATPERVKREIVCSVALCPPGPHALLLTLRVDTLVIAGHVREHLELLGEGVWRHTILLFTHGDQLREGVDIKQHIQGGGRDLQWLLEKCRGRYHVISSLDGGGRAQGCFTKVTELLEKVEKMATMNRCEAFFSLVQEVRDLSQQRNEKFNQRMKEMGDKLLRQEAELKNMREREVKRIRWFFNRDKKVKSPGKADIQREEEDDDRRVDERKNDMGELEERMRWLTEDREKEIQDLSLENERICVALNKRRQDMEEAMLKLERREREIEDLKERADEQQLKLVDVECTLAEMAHERKQIHDAVKVKKQELEKLEEAVELLRKEKSEWIEQFDTLKLEMEENKILHDELLERKEEEKDRQIAEIKQRLNREMEKQQEELRQKASEEQQRILDIAKKDTESKIEEIKSKHQKEIEKKMQEKETEIKEIKLQHQEEVDRKVSEMEKLKKEMDNKLKEKAHDLEKIKQQHDEEKRDLQRENQRQMTELKDQQMKQIAELEQKHHVQMQDSKKDKELMNLNYKKDMEQQMQEREKELDALKLKHQEELKQQLAKETEKQLQDRQRLIRECEQKYTAKIEEIKLEHVKEKDMLNQNLKNLGKLTEELRQQLKSEREESEKKKEIHDKELEEMKQNIEVMEEKLQQNKENERRYEKDIQEKERENKAIKEHLRELQHTEKERERTVKQTVEEKDRVIEKLRQHIKDVDEILQRKEEERGEIILNQKREAEQRLHDKEREMEEMKLQLLNEMDGKLKDKEAEIKSVKQQVDMRETRWRDEQNRKDEQGAMEMNKLIEAINKKTDEVTQVQSLIAQRDCELKEAKRLCEIHLEDIQTLRESNEKITFSLVEIEQSYMKKLREKEEELDSRSQKDSDNEKEIVQLKLTIEQTKTELKELTCKMETEMTSMIQEYEKEIEIKNEDVASVAKVKDGIISRLEQQSSVIKEKYEQSQKKIDEMQEQNETIKKETGNLKIKYEELKKESEEEVRRYEEKVRSIEVKIQTIHEEKEMEVRALQEANGKLQAEIERTKERESENQKQMKELREHFERECQRRDEEIKEKLEKEESDREQILRTTEVELAKKGCVLDSKQEELVEKEEKLEGKERELQTIQASLEKRKEEQEKHEKDVKLREQNVQKKEQDLESLLEALEGKQKELSSHGQDLQKTVKGLKNQGKELKDREYYLKNEEQELLNWKSELQIRNEHVNYTTQELEEMGRGLALLKEELHNKEKNLKESLQKLNKWEQNLTEREEKLSRGERRDLQNGQCSADDNVDEEDAFHQMTSAEGFKENLPLMNQEVSERRERGKVTNREERSKLEEDLRMETAPSAAESNNCHPETLKEKEGSGRETRNKLLSQGHIRSKDSHLRVVVLGETWSSRSPAGVTILGGEASKFDGSSFRPWRGQIAGRHLAVVEPLGLRWRDGLDASNTSQQKSILDSMPWCHPGPHVILLLIPAFLTCTQKYRRAVEEHMRLLGEESWRRTLVVFTWGEILGESAEQHILRNGELMGLVERCEGRYHVLTSEKSNSRIEGLFEKIEVMVTLNDSGEL
ncbi:trichohyalin isoform X2 [Parambassis ranga]|uniref:Trichohyalin isoform X2 n=1 Tax=Parambassis ranga TaxID=210632 RepID=A0A6P7K7L7_9TELE|nr:trichohyalin-like isoform X2 [Parambassis ranga]